MKKSYIKPQITIVEQEFENHILVGSFIREDGIDCSRKWIETDGDADEAAAKWYKGNNSLWDE
ncbi:hypothetical protein [Xylanibacter muris]|uniref:Uncharacterized protein n=1 Tax=Xylanibacter muris TaxID=2736290 RepID=A0ABX2AKR0_9BACT|nr:hypothetical protein [Xylanibacter muris]NPD91778.1 hypothetical protein [Xylanibacter muris]